MISSCACDGGVQAKMLICAWLVKWKSLNPSSAPQGKAGIEGEWMQRGYTELILPWKALALDQSISERWLMKPCIAWCCVKRADNWSNNPFSYCLFFHATCPTWMPRIGKSNIFSFLYSNRGTKAILHCEHIFSASQKACSSICIPGRFHCMVIDGWGGFGLTRIQVQTVHTSVKV